MKPEQGKIQERSADERGSPATTAAAAHELNNLLTLVLGYSQLIVDGTRRTDPNRHSAEQILKAGERAAVLTRQMAEAVGRAGIRVAPLRAAAGHSTSEKSSKPAAPPAPGPPRRAARRG
jgi:hypothetical protein